LPLPVPVFVPVPVPVLPERFVLLPMPLPMLLPVVVPVPVLPVDIPFVPVDMPLAPVDIPLVPLVVVEPDVVLFAIIELFVLVFMLRLFAIELPVFDDSPQAASPIADVKTRPRPNTFRITVLLKSSFT
jgi:hypothetical protein